MFDLSKTDYINNGKSATGQNIPNYMIENIDEYNQSLLFYLFNDERFPHSFTINDDNVANSAKLGEIMNAIQEIAPDFLHDFESSVFNIAQTKKPAGWALKYVGKESIKPKKIEALIDNRWEDVTVKDPTINKKEQSPEQPQSPEQKPEYTSQKQPPKLSYFLHNYIGKLS